MDINHNQSGFTLIELVVTVGIIGLLVSIALPEFREYKRKAYDTVAISNLKNTILVVENYLIDNETTPHCESWANSSIDECKPLLEEYGYSGVDHSKFSLTVHSVGDTGYLINSWSSGEDGHGSDCLGTISEYDDDGSVDTECRIYKYSSLTGRITYVGGIS